MSDMMGRLTVGQVANTHGIRGEIKVWPQTDFADVRFAKGSKLLLSHPDGGEERVVVVERSRDQKNVFIVKLEGINDINEAVRYKGWALKVGDDQRVPLQKDEFYYRDIIGCTVVEEDGKVLGVIDDILRPGANDVWVVNRPEGSPVLLPYIDDVVLSVNVPARTVTVRLMEGMLD